MPADAGRITAQIDGDISGLKSALGQARSEATSAVSGIEGSFKSGLGSGLRDSMSGIAASMGPVGSALSAIGPAGIAAGAGIAVIGGALSSSVQAAAGFETSMSGVAKTTGLAGPELSALGSAILEMSSTMPVAASELANIAQVAGSLGVAKEELAGFSEVAAQMSVAFEMPAEQAATAAAKILTAFGMDIDTSNMESLGNVVNTMGDSFAATEPEVLDFINRASFLNTTMGQSIPQVAALGTALISAGMSSETASTGIKSFLNMATSVTANKDNLTSWATMLGVSVDELKSKLAGDLNGTLAETAQKIAAIQDPTERFQAAVKLAGTEGAPAILKLAAAGDTLQSALQEANSEWENGSSMMKTFEQNSSTLNAEWDTFTNTITRAGVELGNVLLPTITGIVSAMNDWAIAGIEAGEATYDWAVGIGESISDVFSSSDKWLNDTFGFYKAGEAAGEEMAEAIEESPELQEAPGEALGSPEALAGAGEAGKDLAKSVSAEFIPGLEAGMKDLDILAMINSQETAYNATFDRIFDYAGKSLRMHLSEGGSGNYWSLYSGDTLLGKSFGGDAASAFQAITGLPAPAEGAAAYYRLMGDAAEAEMIELQQRLQATPIDLYTGEEQAAFKSQNEEIWANFGESTAQIISDNFDYIGKSGSDDAKAAMDIILDAFAHPDASKVNAVSAALKGLTDSMLDPSQADRLADKFKAAIMPQIADMNMFCELQGEEMGETLTGAFSDAVLTADERDIITALEPMIKLLETEAPEAFKKAGLDSIKAFIEAVKSGASSEDLYNLLKTMFPEAAAASTSALQTTTQATRAATVGYNQLQKAVEDCESCLMSDFGAWQEAQENLFNPSYIGESGQKYLDWKNTVTSAANEAAMAMKGFGYSLPPIFSGEQTQQSIPVSVKLDTSAATSALTEFEGAAKKDVQKPLTIDSTKATASISEVDTAAQKAAVKPLTLDSSQATSSISEVDTAAQKEVSKSLRIDTSAAMSAIASINAAASQPVYKTVYVNEVYTGSGGGGGGGRGSGNGYLGNYMLPPIFMARGGYVSRPTLAVVGEAGPEYVIPAENMAKGLSRMGGGSPINITINSPITGGSGQDIEALLAQRNKELVAEITEQIAAARRGL